MTVSDAAHLWLDRGVGQSGRWAPSSAERYEGIVRLHIDGSTEPSLGSLQLRELTVDHVATWSLANERALAPTTARTTLSILSQVCRFAVRHGWLAENPVARLERAEKPRWTPQPVAVLEGEDLARVLSEAGSHRTLFEFLAYTGLRIGEALGLCWGDIDFDLAWIHRLVVRRAGFGGIGGVLGARLVFGSVRGARRPFEGVRESSSWHGQIAGVGGGLSDDPVGWARFSVPLVALVFA